MHYTGAWTCFAMVRYMCLKVIRKDYSIDGTLHDFRPLIFFGVIASTIQALRNDVNELCNMPITMDFGIGDGSTWYRHPEYSLILAPILDSLSATSRLQFVPGLQAVFESCTPPSISYSVETPAPIRGMWCVYTVVPSKAEGISSLNGFGNTGCS